MTTVSYGEQRTSAEKALDALVKERVELGIMKLQRKYGDDWVEKIDLDKLALSDGQCCVLGQIAGRENGYFMAEAKRLFEFEAEYGEMWNHAWDKPCMEHGFLAKDTPTYRGLNRYWKERIAELKAK